MYGIDSLLDTLIGRDGELTVVAERRDFVAATAAHIATVTGAAVRAL